MRFYDSGVFPLWARHGLTGCFLLCIGTGILWRAGNTSAKKFSVGPRLRRLVIIKRDQEVGSHQNR